MSIESFKEDAREQAFFTLGQKMCAKAERIKGAALNEQEIKDVLEKLREELAAPKRNPAILGPSPFDHIPVPARFKTKMREAVFVRYGTMALVKAQQMKGWPLTDAEQRAVLEKFRATLEARDFFRK